VQPLLVACLLAAQLPQSPSPMVEHTRRHERLERQPVPGERRKLSLGELLLPPGAGGRPVPLVIHFHGAPWLVELSVRRAWPRAAVLAVQLGSGSRVYAEPFRDPGRFAALLAEAGNGFSRVVLTGFSAGYGSIREILREEANHGRVDAVALLDGLHAGYAPPEAGRRPSLEDLTVFLDWARLARGGKKRLLITHSEVFPGTYASTTECAAWLLGELGVARRAVLRWGPLGMQQLSEARAGGFLLLGFAGNSAPDHLDHLHALAWWLRRLR
jgi:hypothetical protein